MSSKPPEPPLQILEAMRHPVPVQERPDAAERRRVAIHEIASAIRQEGRSRAARVRWLGIAAAAAAVFASIGIVRLVLDQSPGRSPAAAAAPHLSAPSTTVRVISGTLVSTRARLSTTLRTGGTAGVSEGDELACDGNGEAALALPRGVRVKLAGATRARIVNALDTEQRLRLELGRVEVSVPRPGGPAVFAIGTPDSEVIVHGTEFSVLVAGDAGAVLRTTVTVTRGSVLVVHAGREELIEAGTTWSSDLEKLPSVDAPSGSVGGEPAATGVQRRARRASSASVPAPSLTDQNRLFQAFLDARDTGDDAAAVRALDELLARFPDTPLAEEARLGRFRALQRLAGKRP